MLCNLAKHITTYTIKFQTLRGGGGCLHWPSGDGCPKKAIEKMILRFIGSRTFSHDLHPERTGPAGVALPRLAAIHPLAVRGSRSRSRRVLTSWMIHSRLKARLAPARSADIGPADAQAVPSGSRRFGAVTARHADLAAEDMGQMALVVKTCLLRNPGKRLICDSSNLI